MVKGLWKRTPHTGSPTAPTKQFLCFFRYKFEEKGQSLFPKIEKGYNRGEALLYFRRVSPRFFYKKIVRLCYVYTFITL